MGLLDVIVGYDCNLACDYCTITPAMRERALSAGRIAAELGAGRRDGYDRVSFTGGEPTLRSDLLALVRRASALGYSDVRVQSNGLLFAHAANLDRLVEAGCTRLSVSIHTHRADRYDALVRREGAYPLMARGLENAVATGLPFAADVIVKSDTHRDLGGAMEWLWERGVRSAHLWFVSLTDQNRDNLASLPRMSEAVPSMAEAFAFGRSRGMEVLSLHVPRCLLGEDAAHAWDPGSQRVRVVTPEATFELRDSRLAGQTHVPACDGCRWRAECPGVRLDYLEVHGDAEIAAARGRSATIAPTRPLPVLSAGPAPRPTGQSSPSR